MPTAMNGANETAVDAFLNNRLGFLDIADIIERTMDSYTVKYDYTVDDLVEADEWARYFAAGLIAAR